MPRKPAGLPPHQHPPPPRPEEPPRERKAGETAAPAAGSAPLPSGRALRLGGHLLGLVEASRTAAPRRGGGGVSISPPALQARLTAHPDRARSGRRLPGGRPRRASPAGPGAALSRWGGAPAEGRGGHVGQAARPRRQFPLAGPRRHGAGLLLTPCGARVPGRETPTELTFTYPQALKYTSHILNSPI